MNESKQKYQEQRAFLWELYRFNSKLGLKRRVKGVEFARCFEYLRACEVLQDRPDAYILDVGSYLTIFPFFLVRQGYRVLATDIDTRLAYQRQWAVRGTPALAPANFQVAFEDATCMGLRDDSFDVVTCISTLEHIPDAGDRLAMREFGRVLHPGGRVFLTVPYARTYHEGTWGALFQRYYDAAALQHRLIEESGLTVLRRGYLLGEPSRNFYEKLYKLPQFLRLASGWSHIFFALYYLQRDVATAENAGIAWVLLEKPA